MKRTVLTLLYIVLLTLPLAFAQSGQRESRSADTSAKLQEAKSKKDKMVASSLRTLLDPQGVSVEETALLRGDEVSQTNAYREVRLRWDAYLNAPEMVEADTENYAKGRGLIITGRRKMKGTLPLPRSVELARDQILVAAINGQGQLRWWSLVADPRVLRAESPDERGQLSGQVLHRSRPEFIVNIPDDAEIKALHFYQTRWTGSEFVLEPLASIPF